jgi:DNA-directed RNA polymerase subunit RPC12/RpoP
MYYCLDCHLYTDAKDIEVKDDSWIKCPHCESKKIIKYD